jgi:hypothetical protein
MLVLCCLAIVLATVVILLGAISFLDSTLRKKSGQTAENLDRELADKRAAIEGLDRALVESLLTEDVADAIPDWQRNRARVLTRTDGRAWDYDEATLLGWREKEAHKRTDELSHEATQRKLVAVVIALVLGGGVALATYLSMAANYWDGR